MKLLIENVTVLSPDREGTLEHQNVAIDGNRIVRLRPSRSHQVRAQGASMARTIC